MLVALLFVLLMGFAALSLDVGRFYAERRYLQNAVDSAALACAQKYSQGGTVQTAWNAADNILQLFNLQANPIGAAITYPGAGDQVNGYTAPLSYADNVVADQNLIGGIKPIAAPLGCRVAISLSVDTFFIKLVQPNLAQIGMVTKAYATSRGGFLPSVTYKYSNGPGPGDGSTNNFIAWTMEGPDPGDPTGTTGKDYQCTASSDSGCSFATPTDPGREHIIFGAGAKATNDSSFRGYIALDIRDFQTVDGSGNPIHLAYNGVSPTASVNTLKSFEGQWIDKGYPGPDICTVDPANFLPCAEIAALDGSSSGIFIADYNRFFKVGDVLLLQLYDGTVKSIPDFTIQAPSLAVPATGSIASTTVQYTMNGQFKASGSVISTELYPDNGSLTGGAGDPSTTNPFMNGAISPCASTAPPAGRLSCGTMSLNPTPAGVSSYSQTWNGLSSSGAQKGTYLAWLRGNATAPYNQRQHDSVVTITVAGQQKDFNLTSSTGLVAVPSVGTQADLSIRVRDSSGSTSWNGGANSVTLSWEACPGNVDPITGILSVLSCKINGSAATTSVNVSVGSGSSVEATFNVDTTTATSDRTYTGWVRGFGRDASGDPVNHVYPVTVTVNVVSGGVTSYVDVIGYAAFRITAITSNDVSGVAVSKTVYDPNDPLLAIAKKIRLVPWETP
ncbi:MAG TPA: pilus assembly protein TadG-related protein [Candidatus Limnocylindria bacterium]|nr:pilus assembly protein TadG-related protein [Candidatus Limnocylindria bacterium]